MKKLLLLSVFGFMAIHINAQIKSPGSDSIDVIQYIIRVDTIDISGQQMYANTEVHFQPRVSALNTIPLDLLSLTVDSVFLNGIKTSAFTYNDTLLQISASPALSGNDTSVVKIFYHGHPVTDPSTWGGFYFSSPYAYNLGVGFESEPHNYGRVWFPCIDDFIDKAFYEVYVTTDTSLMAVCGGTLSDTLSVAGHPELETWHWVLANPIPTYLASMAVGPYQCVSNTFTGMNGTIPIQIYVASAYVSKVAGSFGNLPDVLAIYESYFGPYLWERAGYVGVPFNAGAMEHATSIAYPNLAITGNLTYESLTAHELSHHWFGNLVTCSSANEMWLNEGWAVFSEFIHQEGMYGTNAMNDYIRNTLAGVLKNAHYTDGGFFPVGNVPSELTYSTTVYEKGALMVHTLRNYMGDSLFFPAVKEYLDSLKFKNANIALMRDIFEQSSGMDLNDFFDAWIYREGFPHFDVDSMSVSGSGPYTVEVSLRQKLFGTTQYALSNKVELTFMDSAWNSYSVVAEFSGATGSDVFTVPFSPDIVITDMNEKTADAIVSYNQKVKSAGSYSQSLAYCNIEITQYTDSSLFRIEHHKVAPDPVLNNPHIYRISPNRYWKIGGLIAHGTNFTAQFDYNRTAGSATGYLDTDLLTTSTSGDSLILVYRASASDDWQITPFTKVGNATLGKLKAIYALPGEYALAIGEPFQASVGESNKDQGLIVFPNPSESDVTISVNNHEGAMLSIYDLNGKLVFAETISEKQYTTKWGRLQSDGTYVVNVSDNGKVALSQKFTLLDR